jgi:hypothetical protein
LWAIVLDTAFPELIGEGENQFHLPGSYDKEALWSSEEEMFDWIEGVWDRAINGKNAEGYKSSYAAVLLAENEEQTNILYFSHQKNSENKFRSTDDRADWILETVSLRKEWDPDFQFESFGPFDTGGERVFFIASSDQACGFSGSCGPPWPR